MLQKDYHSNFRISEESNDNPEIIKVEFTKNYKRWNGEIIKSLIVHNLKVIALMQFKCFGHEDKLLTSSTSSCSHISTHCTTVKVHTPIVLTSFFKFCRFVTSIKIRPQYLKIYRPLLNYSTV